MLNQCSVNAVCLGHNTSCFILKWNQSFSCITFMQKTPKNFLRFPFFVTIFFGHVCFLWHSLQLVPLSSFFHMQSRYNQAKLSIHDRALKVAAVVESLEREMELLCLTGVEDQLQADVRPTLELLRNAGIKVSKENNTFINTSTLL